MIIGSISENKNIEKRILIENKDRPFSSNGFRKKFHEMLVHLGLSKEYTPIVFRHGFILKKLNKMNGNFSLVSKEIGVSQKLLIRKYIDLVKISPLNNFFEKSKAVDFEDKKTKTKSGGVGGDISSIGSSSKSSSPAQISSSPSSSLSSTKTNITRASQSLPYEKLKPNTKISVIIKEKTTQVIT